MSRVGTRILRPPRLSAFVLAVLAWLPATFALWYFSAPILLWPAAMLADGAARAAFADLVSDVTVAGATLTFGTTLHPGTALGDARVLVDVNLLLYSFGLPLFAALVLAAHARRWQRNLLAGYLVLVPVVAFCTLADFLENVAITAGPHVASQTGFSPAQREAIAFAFQAASLILPAIVPAIAWVVMHRAFLERMRNGQTAG